MINFYIDYVPVRVGSIPISWMFLSSANFSFSLGIYLRKYIPYSLSSGSDISHALFLVTLCWVLFYLKYQPQLDRVYLDWNYRDQIIKTMEQTNKKSPVEVCSVEIMGTSLLDFSDSYADYMPGVLIGNYYGFDSFYATQKCSDLRTK